MACIPWTISRAKYIKRQSTVPWMTEKGVACFAFQIRMNLCMRPTKEPACLFLSSGFCSSFITLSSVCQHRNFQNHQFPILFLPDISDQSPRSRHDKIKNSASKLNNQLLQFINKNLKSIPCILVGGNYLQVAPLPPTEQILTRFDLPQMLHPLYYLLSCLQY